MTVQLFGKLDDGTDIHEVVLEAEGLRLALISYGASIRDLAMIAAAAPRPLVLGLDSVEDYMRHSSHMGAIAGRYANRIAHGRFELDGRTVQLSLNQAGRHHLHGGGPNGFGKRPWVLVEANDRSARFAVASPDGDEGYPGRCDAACLYELAGPGLVRITLTATADAPTVVNLATHSYFNLDGGPDILDHRLEIPAGAYTPVDADLIPTGEIAPVAGTPFDFRQSRPVRHESQTYDHNWVVHRDRATAPRLLARLTGPRTGTTLEVHSTEPGIQFYDASKMNLPVTGTYGRRFGPHAGLCLEPQLFPDTPNNPQFGSAVLRPGETYRQVTEYRIATA